MKTISESQIYSKSDAALFKEFVSTSEIQCLLLRIGKLNQGKLNITSKLSRDHEWIKVIVTVIITTIYSFYLSKTVSVKRIEQYVRIYKRYMSE